MRFTAGNNLDFISGGAYAINFTAGTAGIILKSGTGTPALQIDSSNRILTPAFANPALITNDNQVTNKAYVDKGDKFTINNATMTGTINYNYDSGDVVNVGISSNSIITVSNLLTGNAMVFIVNNTGGYTVTYGAVSILDGTVGQFMFTIANASGTLIISKATKIAGTTSA